MALVFKGFSGLPAMGAAGIKAPIVLDEEAQRYGVVRDGHVASWCNEQEFDEHVQQRLATKAHTSAEYVAAFVALYAHVDFVIPPPASREPGCLELSRLSTPDALHLHSQEMFYLGYMLLDAARPIFAGWADSLCRSALAALRLSDASPEERGSVAYAEAMRARIALAALKGEHAHDQRRKASAIAWAALALQKQSTAGLEQVTALEFPDGSVVATGKDLLRSQCDAPPAPPQRYRDARTGRRHLEAAP